MGKDNGNRRRILTLLVDESYPGVRVGGYEFVEGNFSFSIAATDVLISLALELHDLRLPSGDLLLGCLHYIPVTKLYSYGLFRWFGAFVLSISSTLIEC